MEWKYLSYNVQSSLYFKWISQTPKFWINPSKESREENVDWSLGLDQKMQVTVTYN